MYISDSNKLIIALVVIVAIIYYMRSSNSYSSSYAMRETMTEAVPNEGEVVIPPATSAPAVAAPQTAPVVVAEPAIPQVSQNEIAQMGSELDQFFSNDLANTQVSGSFGNDFATLDTVGPLRQPSTVRSNRDAQMERLAAENQEKAEKYNNVDLLPKEVNDQWFQTDFSLAEVVMDEKNLLNTDKYHIPINTVGSSKRNASYDLRPNIVNPKTNVGPFLNSTIDPDLNIKGW